MALCCFGPIIIIFLVGKTKVGLPTWLILGVIAVCAIVHFTMHGRHKHFDDLAINAKIKPEDKE